MANLPSTPISVNCAPIEEREKEVANAGIAIINSASCPCTVPNQDTTWGVIKELYRDVYSLIMQHALALIVVP